MAQSEINDLSQDTPLITPEQDRLGYANFAKHLADSICTMNFTETFAIAVSGSWNTGKSTLLNFVVHYLQQKPDEEKPIIIPFNPWLFSGRDNITRSFFSQLQNVLSKATVVPKGITERIADFGKVIGEIPLPYTQAGKALVKLLDEKEREPYEIKEQVEDTLTEQQRRIVVTIDDIDRLKAEDIKELFRLLRAIPNFTNVVYLLVFNKEVVIKALTDNEETLREVYFEKMIQIAFELPCPDKTSLRRLLFERLEGVFADTPNQTSDMNCENPTTDMAHLFEPTRWANVYFQGIDHFINNLSDIIRLTNALKVTYVATRGEVNPVDFIALESLRVFCPLVYDIVRKNKNAFVGKVDSELEELNNFHNSWLAQLADKETQPVQKLLINLFPKLEVIWGSRCHSEKQELESSQRLRVCCPERFSAYFRLNLLESSLPNTQVESILASACDAKVFGEKLIELANQKNPDGTTQLRGFLERLKNSLVKEISTQCIPSIVEAFFDVGEKLLCPEDEPITKFDFGNEMRICRLILQLLCRLDKPARFEVLKTAMSQGDALSIITKTIETISAQQASTPEEEWLISAAHLKELRLTLAPLGKGGWGDL